MGEVEESGRGSGSIEWDGTFVFVFVVFFCFKEKFRGRRKI